MPRRSRKSKKNNQLILSEKNSRLKNLKKRRQRLQKRIERTRATLAHHEQECERFVREIGPEIRLLIERSRSLDGELHQLFAEIFQTRTFGKRSGRQIRNIYESLQVDGVISNRLDRKKRWLPLWDDDDEPADDVRPDEHGAAQRDGEWANSDHNAERPLRDIFLNLATSFHPDLARDDENRIRRTEAMKEINRAYREGDAASLLAMELSLELDGPEQGADRGDDDQAVCARLETHIKLLEQQLAALENELAERRDSDFGILFEDSGQSGRRPARNPLEWFLIEFRESLDQLEELRDFVHQFRHRKMTIKAFVRGPTVTDEADLLELLIDRLEFESPLAPERQ